MTGLVLQMADGVYSPDLSQREELMTSVSILLIVPVKKIREPGMQHCSVRLSCGAGICRP